MQDVRPGMSLEVLWACSSVRGYNLERYVELWGSAKCTNRLSFNYSQPLMARRDPNPSAQSSGPHLSRTSGRMPVAEPMQGEGQQGYEVRLLPVLRP